jgi:hypothetical protein
VCVTSGIGPAQVGLVAEIMRASVIYHTVKPCACGGSRLAPAFRLSRTEIVQTVGATQHNLSHVLEIQRLSYFWDGKFCSCSYERFQLTDNMLEAELGKGLIQLIQTIETYCLALAQNLPYEARLQCPPASNGNTTVNHDA